MCSLLNDYVAALARMDQKMCTLSQAHLALLGGVGWLGFKRLLSINLFLVQERQEETSCALQKSAGSELARGCLQPVASLSKHGVCGLGLLGSVAQQPQPLSFVPVQLISHCCVQQRLAMAMASLHTATGKWLR